MLQLTFIRDNKAATIAGLQKRYFANAETTIELVLTLDQQRREAQREQDDAQARANAIAKEIGALMKAGNREAAEAAKAETAALKTRIRDLEESFTAVDQQLHDLLLTIPNLPHASVPAGRSADDNEVLLEHGAKPELYAGAVPHWDLIKQYSLVDFDLGNKITGAGFPVYTGRGARLQRALINFFLNEATAAGYLEIQPPILINRESGYGTGQLPDKDGQMYHAERDDLFLIPTAEVPLTNLYRDVIVAENQLPIKLTGHTPCFRREAGAWGAHVRGLNRLHQFDKIEIVQIRKPEESYQAIEEMSFYVQGILQKLDLPYRVLRLCGGDMGFTSALTYDMEVWSAGQGRWLEVSSVSNFETYQANRLKLRHRVEGKTQLLHTLNGSALALPRIVGSLLENNQTPDGIRIPPVLVPYCGFDFIHG